MPNLRQVSNYTGATPWRAELPHLADHHLPVVSVQLRNDVSHRQQPTKGWEVLFELGRTEFTTLETNPSHVDISTLDDK